MTDEQSTTPEAPAAEQVIHETLRVAVDELYKRYGLLIHGVRFEWTNLSTHSRKLWRVSGVETEISSR